ncbi:hypothetical protein [Ancylobacter polymorphus]|uniref:Uncharacterized protein n=1 Tax=Ancylobacter polymorphus TaxID=223390 RepID=A0ABU0BCI2_9HYPH|nr:hypothetical protein [Ancylobacter polymorphus]MDQ0302169.1 hypothetical protein [Ancylobacter polymorphus]
MSTENTPRPAESPPEPADERRRAALRRLGKAAINAAPATPSLLAIRRAAADS